MRLYPMTLWPLWSLVALSASAAAAVIPEPLATSSGEGGFVLGPQARIVTSASAEPRRIARYLQELLKTTAGLETDVLEAADPGATTGVIALVLEPGAAGAEPEGYALQVSRGGIRIAAHDPRGLLYGAITLWQLIEKDPQHPARASVHAVRILDRPRFRWRGLMLDSARHYQSADFILKLIDWMALHKLNVLHWHLTDDQAWRLEIKRYPRLTEVGGWRVPAGAAAAADIDPATGRPRLYGGYYSQETVRRIVAHAAERNVTVVPEIEMPGHATAAIVAYPELAATDHPPTTVSSDWGIFTNLYNVDDRTFTFLEHVLDEVLSLFPSEYIHVGGDEAVKDQWQASAHIQQRMRELGVPNEQALQSYFTRRIEKYLNARGRRLIGWDEILEGGIAQNATVMSWRGIDGAVAAARAGHDAVLTPWPTLYFDNRQGTGPREPAGRGGVSTVEDVYRFDPAPPALSPQEQQHILGVQGNLWTEHVRTEQHAEYMIFPRAAAVAEVGWADVSHRSWQDFSARLARQLERYDALGIHYSNDLARTTIRGRPEGTARHMSQDLDTCSSKLLLNLEDDAPLAGPRAVFLVDIENPCWKLPDVDLSQGVRVQAAVGQVPFNFQIGTDRDAIALRPPRSPAGELEVRVDGCEGSAAAVLPLAPALGNHAVTVLPRALVARRPGRHELCFQFTQRTLDPLWVLDWVQVAP